MEKQKVIGYRELSPEDIIMMNKVKAQGVELEALAEQLKQDHYDQRWVSIGVTDLQKGLMALIRAVAQPTTF